MVRVEQQLEHLHRVVESSDLGLSVDVDSGSATQNLGQIMATPPDDVVDGVLSLLVALARATVGGADGASVSLQRRGRLATVAASDETVAAMDGHQYATGEGPCVDASTQGRPFHFTSLDDESRWPNFTPKARALGIKAILSSPLLAGEQPVGALNIYSRAPDVFSTEEQGLAAKFASEVSIILQGAGVDLSDERWAARLSEALRTRQIIAEAQGITMDRNHVSEEEAFTLLRTDSQRRDRPLRDIAVEVVSSAIRPVAALDSSRGAHG